jgi:hypothetical protein
MQPMADMDGEMIARVMWKWSCIYLFIIYFQQIVLYEFLWTLEINIHLSLTMFTEAFRLR